MAKNLNPIMPLNGVLGVNDGTTMAPTLTTAAADYTGISANNKLVFTADATDGSLIRALRFKAIGTNVASVARIYFNNGAAQTTATNNTFFGEVTLPATTASAVAATIDLEYTFPNGGVLLPAGFTVWVGLGTTVAAGWVVSPIGVKYD